MVAAMTTAMEQAMRAGAPRAMLAELDHPDGTVRTWSRAGTLDYDGHAWQGLGILGQVTPVVSTGGLAIRAVAFELHLVPPAVAAQISETVRGRSGRVWLACIRSPRSVVPDPLLMVDAVLAVQELEVGDDAMATVRITGEQGFWTLERAQDLAYTPEEHKRTYPDDVGLDRIPALTDKDVRWTPS